MAMQNGRRPPASRRRNLPCESPVPGTSSTGEDYHSAAEDERKRVLDRAPVCSYDTCFP